MLPVMLPTLAKCKTRLLLLDQNASSVQISDEHWMKSQNAIYAKCAALHGLKEQMH